MGMRSKLIIVMPRRGDGVGVTRSPLGHSRRAWRRRAADSGREPHCLPGPHAVAATRLAGCASTLRRLRAARPATPHAKNCELLGAARVGHSQWEYASTDLRTVRLRT